jgi:hypothetical protein
VKTEHKENFQLKLKILKLTADCRWQILANISEKLTDSINRVMMEAIKSKAVPLHAMKALGGRGSTAPTHS